MKVRLCDWATGNTERLPLFHTTTSSTPPPEIRALVCDNLAEVYVGKAALAFAWVV